MFSSASIVNDDNKVKSQDNRFEKLACLTDIDKMQDRYPPKKFYHEFIVNREQEFNPDF